MSDDLERFVSAQAKNYADALREITLGHKTSHWMWYVCPQLRSLGRSGTAQFYGIADLEEAQAYMAHPVLGPRLLDISQAMLAHAGTRPEDTLGPVDALKLRSSMTLFEIAAPDQPVFGQVLDAFYAGDRCPLTLAELTPA